MELIEPEYEGQLVHIDTHVSGVFNVAGGTARGSRYNVGGIPHVQFDGLTSVVGAGSCGSAANSYRSQMNNRINATGGVTAVDLNVVMNIVGNQATVTATAELVDNISLNGLQMTLFIMEDDLTWCCDPQGGSHFNNMTRGINSQPLTLTFGGGEVDVEHAFTLNGAWVPDNIWAAAVVEYVGGTREVFQSAQYKSLVEVRMDQAVASIPDGSGEILVTGEIFNGNDLADVFDLNISGDQGGWTQEFQLDGDPNWYTSTTLALDPCGDEGRDHACHDRRKRGDRVFGPQCHGTDHVVLFER